MISITEISHKKSRLLKLSKNMNKHFIDEIKQESYDRFFDGIITGTIIILGILIYARIAELIV